jgi:hypothetical protein
MNLDKATRRKVAGGVTPTADRWRESSKLFFGSTLSAVS